MYCKKCGTKLNEGQIFCGGCGTAVTDFVQPGSFSEITTSNTFANPITIVLQAFMILMWFVGGIVLKDSSGLTALKESYSFHQCFSECGVSAISFILVALLLIALFRLTAPLRTKTNSPKMILPIVMQVFVVLASILISALIKKVSGGLSFSLVDASVNFGGWLFYIATALLIGLEIKTHRKRK